MHSGFGSKKIQYEINIYRLKNLFYFYKNVGFSIARKQNKLKQVINSYDYYSRELFEKAKRLHRSKGFRKVAKIIKVPENVVYRWLFKDYQSKILDLQGGEL